MLKILFVEQFIGIVMESLNGLELNLLKGPLIEEIEVRGYGVSKQGDDSLNELENLLFLINSANQEYRERTFHSDALIMQNEFITFVINE
jgi:hypothetical protein